ncbi:CHAT domain-containing protein [Streptomyces scopuliridis]|uniref:CHAT domain-containing protein n=1 Tax=Streptomyces scopuliridis TaxID=452529 RepID=UPI002DD8AF14|nr:CHAT domain-containing protein [Streptomyces scopuliridis]WSB37352.1 CHAT domain-containing protein [Streptomyces scopuliridis]
MTEIHRMDPVERARQLADWGIALSDRFLVLGDRTAGADPLAPDRVREKAGQLAVQEARDVLMAADRELPLDDPRRLRLDVRLGSVLMIRHVRFGGEDEEREIALTVFRRVHNTARPGTWDHDYAQLWLGWLLFFPALPRQLRLGDPVDFESARRWMQAPPSDPAVRARLTANLDESIGYLQYSSVCPRWPEPVRAPLKLMLGLVPVLRMALGQPFDPLSLMRSLPLFQQGIGLMPKGAANRTELQTFAHLAALEVSRHTDGAPGETGPALEAAIDTLPPGHLLRDALLGELAQEYLERASDSGTDEDLGAASAVLARARAEITTDSPWYDSVLDLLGSRQFLEALRHRSPDLVDESVVAGVRALLRWRPEGAPAPRAVPLNGLSEALDAADEVLERTAGLAPDDTHPGMAHLQVGGSLMLRAVISGETEDSRRALAHLRRATELIPAEHPVAPAALAMLGGTLDYHYLRHGTRQDAETGRIFLDHATGAAVAHRPVKRPARYQKFGETFRALALGLRAREEGDGAAEALAELRTLVGNDGSRLWPASLSIATAFGVLRQAVTNQNWDELPAALDLLDEAAIGDDLAIPWLQPVAATFGGLAAVVRGAVRGDTAELRRGTSLLEELMTDESRLPADIRLLGHSGLGSARLLLNLLNDDPEVLATALLDLERARERMGPDTPPSAAVAVLDGLADGYRRRGDPAAGDASAAVDAGLAVIRTVAAEVMLQRGAHHGLLPARGAARRAVRVAHWSLEDGHPRTAVEALELGRALVLRASTTATDVPDRLVAAGRADLADRWREHVLDSPAPVLPPAPPLATSASAPVSEGAPDAVVTESLRSTVRLLLEQGMPGGEIPSELRREALGVLAEHDGRHSLHEALTPAALGKSLAAVDADALVYLLDGPEDSEAPGAALLVDTDGRVVHVPLPGLAQRACGPLRSYISARAAFSRARGAERESVGTDWRAALEDLCDWAYPAAMGPVLDEIATWDRGQERDQDRERDSGGAPHLVLVPCSTLGVVTWHAARTPVPGTGDAARHRYVIQDAVVSYAASGRQFAEAAGRDQLPPAEDPVIVLDPSGDLLWPVLEAEGIRDAHYPRARVLGAETETAEEHARLPERVLACLPSRGEPGASLLHLGCHADTREVPLDSALLFGETRESERAARTELTLPISRVLERAAGRRPGSPGGLVVLNACLSDLSERDHDEALTLATTFLTAGATGVVGSRWNVPDRPSGLLMTVLHHHLSQGVTPARALRAAQLWMLDPERAPVPGMSRLMAAQVPDAEHLHTYAWAAYTHQGR